MTEKQYRDYCHLKQEIEPIKNFLFWCGNKYICKGVNRYKFSLVALFKRIAVQFISPSGEKEKCELPPELQNEIIKVIEDYVTKKEQEIKEI